MLPARANAKTMLWYLISKSAFEIETDTLPFGNESVFSGGGVIQHIQKVVWQKFNGLKELCDAFYSTSVTTDRKLLSYPEPLNMGTITMGL